MWAIQPGPAAMRRALPSGRSYTQKIQALGPIAYYPQAEPSGTTIGDESGNGRNGTYVGVTLGQPGIGDGRTAAGYDGVTSYGNIYSASLAAAFNSAEGSIVTPARVANAGVWTDGINRDLIILQADTSNNLFVRKSATNATIRGTWQGGGVSSTVQTGSFSPTGWFYIAITWSKAANELKFYLNGAQSGATQTMVGVWTGALAAGTCTIGSGGGAVRVHSGSLAHTAIFNRALSAAEIASLAVVP